ncbi:MAG: sulfatase [Pseudomonadota bacterium]
MSRLLATLFLVIATTGFLQAAESPSQKPNIVILFADDLGYGDLGSYGHPYIRTPNLDKMAAEGQRWTDFYVAAPVCSPSRGALLTGRLPNRTGLYGKQIGVLFPNDPTGMPDSEHTLAEALKEQGYATAIIGKWHLGDMPDVYPTRHGFDYWYGIPYSNDMDWVNEPTMDEFMAMRAAGKIEEIQQSFARRRQKYFAPKNEYWAPPVIRSSKSNDGFKDEVAERPAQQALLTKSHTKEATSFIERNQDKPFLLYVPYSMPHTPIFRSKEFEGKSLGGRYGDVIEEIDWSVGEIVNTLKKLELDEKTLVVFTSDNGPWLSMNTHGGSAGLLNNGKGTTYEGGMRVPAIFWWPGNIQPAVVSDIGSAMDLYVTSIKLAGAELQAKTDGFDISQTLLKGTPGPREAVAYYRQGELRAFRKGSFKLHLITEGDYSLPPERTEHETPVLFNLREDPSEKFDIAAQHPEVVADILKTINQHRAMLSERPPLFDNRLH